jgi:hypothetical protein
MGGVTIGRTSREAIVLQTSIFLLTFFLVPPVKY